MKTTNHVPREPLRLLVTKETSCFRTERESTAAEKAMSSCFVALLSLFSLFFEIFVSLEFYKFYDCAAT